MRISKNKFFWLKLVHHCTLWCTWTALIELKFESVKFFHQLLISEKYYKKHKYKLQLVFSTINSELSKPLLNVLSSQSFANNRNHSQSFAINFLFANDCKCFRIIVNVFRTIAIVCEHWTFRNVLLRSELIAENTNCSLNLCFI